MKIKLGETAETKKTRATYDQYNTPAHLRCFTPMPRVLFSLEPNPDTTKWLWILGRIYSGYVGLMCNTPLFQLNIWIENVKR